MAKKNPAFAEKKASHKDWIQLLEISGPFPSPSQWKKAYESDAPDRYDTPELKFDLREARHVWRSEPATVQSQLQWVEKVLKDLLELGKNKGQLLTGSGIDSRFRPERPGGEALLQPAYVLTNSARSSDPEKGRLLIHVTAPGQSLTRPARHASSAPRDQMVDLCRMAGVPLGLLTNGEDWMLIHAPVGETSTFVSWDATLWVEEPLTFNAFVNLLHADRFFVQGPRQTELMFKDALSNQFELTNELGHQVREAVEILIRRFSMINPKDHPYHAELLEGFTAEEIYRGTLTLMMRLVVVLCAEERGLFPLHDDFYREHYALSTMLDQLQHSQSLRTDDVLQRQYDAWHRLLATFRLIFDGIHHDRFSFRGYGSSLFDPDRAPFLEGRQAGTHWKDIPARPLPVDNLTVLRVLQKLQMLGIEGEARLLSFRALDPEQIGYVYEGLLDHTAKRTGPDEVVLGIAGPKRSGKGKKKQDQDPEIPLTELEALMAEDDGPMKVVQHLHTLTGRSVNDLAATFAQDLDENSDLFRRLRTICDNQQALYNRIYPFAYLLREDEYGFPFVVLPGRVYVTEGQDRRSSGAHYTPRFLCEEVVQHTLDPLVYIGPAEGKPESEWQLKPPHELLALKVCDLAMGSGAFLVQACRYLSEKLVRSWDQLGQRQAANAPQDPCHSALDAESGQQSPQAPTVRITPYGEPSQGLAQESLIPLDPEDQLIYARHLVVSHCLYGVDKNPMAVEMAKLSLWLITLDPHQPFTFLDSHLRCGDSLLGITDLAQLENFHLNPEEGKRIHKFKGGIRDRIQKALARVKELRQELENAPELDLSDMRRKAELYEQTQSALTDVKLFADYLVGVGLQLASKKKADDEWGYYGHKLEQILDGDLEQERLGFEALKEDVTSLLGIEPSSGQGRVPFHWVLEFPEVFAGGGFDAMIGNPPFLGGQKLTGTFGEPYREYLVDYLGRSVRGSADLCAYFYLQAHGLIQPKGCFGLIATNTIAQGDTREVGLDQLLSDSLENTQRSSVYRANPSMKWPGAANLEVALVWLIKSDWQGSYWLNRNDVKGITSQLTLPGRASGKPYRLKTNANKSFQGSIVLGMGFVLTPEQALELIAKNPKNKDVLFPYLNGEDLNSRPDQSPSRWVINFFDWPLEQASSPNGYSGSVAADYPDCLEIVERLVKPERDKTRDTPDGKKLKKFWWQFCRNRAELYEIILNYERVLCKTRHSPNCTFEFVQPRLVFQESLVIFPFDKHGIFALLSSTIHESWAWQYGSTIKRDLRYSPSDCFETFPFPDNEKFLSLETIGEKYYLHRRQIMHARNEGLTKTYNRFHNPVDQSQDIVELRQLHVDMDKAVSASYGWSDLNLDHGFHETKQGLRFTVSNSVRQEILDRLLELNFKLQNENIESKNNQNAKINKNTNEVQLSIF